ncbi:hypothetical protein GCM10010389_30840 [Streptomyces echinoruber]|uniref:Uncharacterized protein n=1 Tax=Streptomyces echinoruber TaxID=68898 RepID=A0A918VC66_9ACTN|nr:hypothetical protein GCM10010389_30840 [Streptomyces echinoruber]
MAGAAEGRGGRRAREPDGGGGAGGGAAERARSGSAVRCHPGRHVLSFSYGSYGSCGLHGSYGAYDSQAPRGGGTRVRRRLARGTGRRRTFRRW